MSRQKPLLAVLLVSALVAACQGPAAPGAPVPLAPAMRPVSGTYTVKGVLTSEGLAVQQAGASAVGDAEVYLDDLPHLRTRSRADGSFELAGVPAGEHFVVGEKGGANGGFKVRAKVSLAPEQPVADLQSLLLRRTGAVTGLVTLEGGGGTLGADVFVAGSTMIAKAKENGAYGLANVAEGVYKVTATYPGYQPATLEVEVKAGRPSTLDLTLKKLDPAVAVSLLKGTITGADGRAVPGATVSVRGASSFSTLADEQGRFVLGNLPDGSYDLLVFAPGLSLYSRSIAMDAAKGKERELGAIALSGASLPSPAAAVTPAPAASVAPVASQAPATTAPSVGPYGLLDSQLLKPGGATRSTNAGLNAIGNSTYDVALGQGFKPSRDGKLQTFALMVGAASADVVLSIYEADRGFFPDVTKLKGSLKLPAAEAQGFNEFTYFRFATPLALVGGKTYVAVVTCPGGVASVALSDKPSEAGKLSLSFAQEGGEQLSWDTTPPNEGFETLAHRVYLAP